MKRKLCLLAAAAALCGLRTEVSAHPQMSSAAILKPISCAHYAGGGMRGLSQELRCRAQWIEAASVYNMAVMGGVGNEDDKLISKMEVDRNISRSKEILDIMGSQVVTASGSVIEKAADEARNIQYQLPRRRPHSIRCCKYENPPYP
ncbi:MAG: hypothetical protein HY921_04910 [Elusimicrobia bacterium]|nr:hypothetical protein [Elusimicrobiota bacterium]